MKAARSLAVCAALCVALAWGDPLPTSEEKMDTVPVSQETADAVSPWVHLKLADGSSASVHMRIRVEKEKTPQTRQLIGKLRLKPGAATRWRKEGNKVQWDSLVPMRGVRAKVITRKDKKRKYEELRVIATAARMPARQAQKATQPLVGEADLMQTGWSFNWNAIMNIQICQKGYTGTHCNSGLTTTCGPLKDFLTYTWKTLKTFHVNKKFCIFFCIHMSWDTTYSWRLHDGKLEIQEAITFKVNGATVSTNTGTFQLAQFSKDSAGRWKIPCISRCHNPGGGTLSFYMILGNQLNTRATAVMYAAQNGMDVYTMAQKMLDCS